MNSKKQGGFSLIELLLTIGVIAIIVTIGLQFYSSTSQSAEKLAIQKAAAEIENYYACAQAVGVKHGLNTLSTGKQILELAKSGTLRKPNGIFMEPITVGDNISEQVAEKLIILPSGRVTSLP